MSITDRSALDDQAKQKDTEESAETFTDKNGQLIEDGDLVEVENLDAAGRVIDTDREIVVGMDGTMMESRSSKHEGSPTGHTWHLKYAAAHVTVLSKKAFQVVITRAHPLEYLGYLLHNETQSCNWNIHQGTTDSDGLQSFGFTSLSAAKSQVDSYVASECQLLNGIRPATEVGLDSPED